MKQLLFNVKAIFQKIPHSVRNDTLRCFLKAKFADAAQPLTSLLVPYYVSHSERSEESNNYFQFRNLSKIILLLTTITLVTCNDKLDLVEEGPDVPIIYAILDYTDSIHYVRINKSFNGNVLSSEMAQNPDSILYRDSLNVKVFILDKDDETVKELNFRKINLKKDSVNHYGNVVFAVNKHYVYVNDEGKLPNGKDYFYKLDVRFKNGNLIATAKTNALSSFRFNHPVDSGMSQLMLDRRLSTGWIKDPYAGLVTIKLTIYYYEYNAKEDRFYIRSVEESTDGNVPARVGGYGFYSIPIFDKIIEQIDKTDSPDITRRYIGKMTVNYSAANIDFAEQMAYYGYDHNPSFEEQQVQPFTNIQGGYGLFGARITGKIEPVLFDYYTRNNFATELMKYSGKKLKFAPEPWYYWYLPDSLLWKVFMY